MKKLVCFFLVVIMIVTCLAAGDPNIDGGGGGGTGEGNADSAWNGGDDGVRVSVLRGSTPVAILDYSNEYRNEVMYCFIPQCKLSYRNGVALTPSFDKYHNLIPVTPLPRIISTSGTSTLAAIKSYFTDEYVLRNLADDVHMSYEALVGGDYKLMLEPISYFKYKGVRYAMTATEAGLYDVQVEGQLKYWMGTLTHQNQPLCMFLEREELGIIPWEGPTTGKQVNIDIINFLGVGIVSFREPPEIEPPTSKYVYRTDTDVITAVTLRNPTEDEDWTPGAARAEFQILGSSYYVNYVCPAGGTQLVWVKWHTPSTPQTVKISVYGRAGQLAYVTAEVVDLPDNEPPDPGYYDTNPSFRLQEPPSWGNQNSVYWDAWVAVWIPPASPGANGYWNFYVQRSTVKLEVDYSLEPDSRVRTANIMAGDRYEIKSGYGVNTRCEVKVIGDGTVSNYDVTPVQNVVAVFPEFNYQTYDRLLQPERWGFYDTTWQFKPNRYSFYENNTHFTPLWYPDGVEYPVPLAVFDVWTPGGMLHASAVDSVDIDGDVFDDWYIRTLTH